MIIGTKGNKRQTDDCSEYQSGVKRARHGSAPVVGFAKACHATRLNEMSQNLDYVLD